MLYPVSEVRNFVTGLDHPEGVAVGRSGNLYAGGEAGQVYRISADGGKIEVVASTGGACLGITLDRDENIYICDLGQKALFKVTQQGAVTMLADAADGRKLVSPNFSVFDSRGNLYFSDSGVWKEANGVVCKLDRDGKATIFSPALSTLPTGLLWTHRNSLFTSSKAILTGWFASRSGPMGRRATLKSMPKGWNTSRTGWPLIARAIST